MEEANMPATEAAPVLDEGSNHYELAFHILPTVAEGEVPEVQSALRDAITKAGGTIDTEETAARLELAYTIYTNIEGKKHPFETSYFGWIRCTGAPELVQTISNVIDARTDILRYVVIKLTKEEAEKPFMVHEKPSKMPEVVGDEADAADEADEAKNAAKDAAKSESDSATITAPRAEEDASEKVEEKELDASLGKITQ